MVNVITSDGRVIVVRIANIFCRDIHNIYNNLYIYIYI